MKEFPRQLQDSLEKVVNYITETESESFEDWMRENEEDPEGHIFTHAKKLREFLDASESGTTISFSWSVDDVLEQANQDDVTITEEEAKEILATIKSRHDSTIGVNWDIISSRIKDYVVNERDKKHDNN